MTVKPTLNKVVVRPDEKEEMSAGGIALPPKSTDKPNRGIVLYAGAGRYTDTGVRIPMDIDVGEFVFYHKNFAVPIKLNGEDVLVLKEEDVLVSVKEGA